MLATKLTPGTLVYCDNFNTGLGLKYGRKWQPEDGFIFEIINVVIEFDCYTLRSIQSGIEFECITYWFTSVISNVEV